MYVHNLSPFAIEIGSGGLRWYGLAYLAGFLMAYLIISYYTKKYSKPMSSLLVGDFVFTVAIGIIVGGRLGYCLFYDTSLLFKFSSQIPFWGVLEVHHGGMASHGGILGIIISCLIFAKQNKISVASLFDLVALTGPIGIFFGRLANFINGELVGRPCSEAMPFAVKFPQDIFAWPYHEPHRLASLSPVVEKLGMNPETWFEMIKNPLSSTVQLTLSEIIERIQHGNIVIQNTIAPLLTSRHPSQLYEAILEGFLIFIIVLIAFLRNSKPGTPSALFIMFYAAFRIFGEQFRMPDLQIGFQLFGLTRGQWLSIGMLAMGALFLLHRRFKSLLFS